MKVKSFNFAKGRGGEEQAREFLSQKGFTIIEANYANIIGEIDIVAVDQKTLVFVEVKYKSDDRLGRPEEMISRAKLHQIRRVAESYLVFHPEMRREYDRYRIDAVTILDKEISYYPNIG